MADPCSILKLVIEKGPRQGETLEFRPGSIIRLGRVVRGNSVTIKDSAISTKHLEIHFESDSGKWVITDLGSSNGTLLNDSVLDANTPFRLSNNDIIKLGEITLIVVNICGNDVAGKRRNGGVVEGSEVGLGENVVEKSRRGRKRGNDGVRKREVEGIGNVKGNGNVVCVEVNQGRQLRSRVTKNVIKEEGGKLGFVEDFGNQLDRLAAIERKSRKGRGKKMVVEERIVVEEDLVKDLPQMVLDQDVKDSIMMNEFSDKLGVGDVLEMKDVEQKEDRSGVKNRDVDFGVELDLERMTLGRWFDFLEVYLPRKIHDETEELISDMKLRAKQFHQYSVQQKRVMGMGKSPMA